MGLFRDMAKRGKDLALSSTVQKIVEKHVSPFGKLLSFKLDMSAGSMEALVLLKGETDPVSVSIRKFEIIQKDDGSYVIIRDMEASREWIAAASREYILDRRIRIPEAAAKMLGFLT